MSFWKPIRILLRVRWQAARTRLTANPTAALWTVLVILLLFIPALSLGNHVGAPWSTLSHAQAETSLGRLWLEMQAFWLLTLLFPGGIALLGPIPPRSILLPFALRPLQVFVAEVSAVLLDVPVLLACALVFPLLCALLGAAQWLEAVVMLLAFVGLGVQTGLCARLLASLSILSARRFRRLALLPGVTAVLLLGLCAGVPPAFASLTSSPAQQFLSKHVALPSRWRSVDLTPLLPSHLAAHAVVSTRRGNGPEALGALGGLAVCLFLTGGAAVWAWRDAEKAWVASEGGTSATPRTKPVRTTARSQAGPFHQTAALVKTEWHLLLRTPQNYLPLRKPASLLLLGVFVFLSPDMGRNPVANLKEFLALGTLLYSVLWQLQLLCNRFGNEAGTGTLLFGFSIPRLRLLLGKNIALFGLLLLVDSPVLIGMAFVAEVPERSGLFLLWLPLILLTLTSFGNIASALRPFAILRQEKQGGAEPPDTLAWAYGFIGAGTVALLTPIAALLSHGVWGWLGAVATLSALYVASLVGASALLNGREVPMIAALDRGSL